MTHRPIGADDVTGELPAVVETRIHEWIDDGDALNIPLTEKGAPNGVATLDGGGKVPSSQLPLNVVQFKGTWDASTNTPTLADGSGDTGDVYIVAVAGTQNLGSGSISFGIGDWVLYDGTVWQKVDNTDAVVSVNSKTGVVTLNASEIPFTPTGSIAATNTQAAIAEVSTETAAVLANKIGTNADTPATAIYWAPPPSGNRVTDTNAVQALVDAAQTSGGTVVLGFPGVYKLDIVTQKQNTNPSIVSVAQNTWDGTLRINGNSGQQSRCHLHGIRFGGTVSGAKLTLAGVNNVTWSRLRFTDTGDVGILFYNDNVGEYTELCHGEADFASSIPVAVEYRINHGDPSFHGSGLDLGSTINQSVTETQPKIKVGALCRPYGAPMSATVWVRTSTPIIDMDGANNSHFYGNLKVESFSASATTVCDGRLVYAGTVSLYDENISLGDLVVADIVRSDTSLQTVASVSTATQTALDLKANLASPTFTGDPKAPTPSPGDNDTSVATTAFVTAAISTAGGSYQPLDPDLTAIATINAVTNNVIGSNGTTWVGRTYAQLKTAMAFVKGDVGLGNVDNVQQQPLDADLTTIAAINAGTGSGVLASDGAGWIYKTYIALKTALSLTKSDVGLGNVDNTSDANKPVSTATQTALDLKADLASPAFTGNPTVPTQTAGTNNTRAASTAYADASSVAAVSGKLLTPTAAIAETIPRSGPFASATALVSGRIFCQAIYLQAGQTVNSITWIAAGQAIVGGSNQWFGLFDLNRNKLAVTNDDGANAWNGQQPKTLSLTAPYAVTTTGVYYVSCLVVASTANNLQGYAANAVVVNRAPRMSGTADTGLTNPASCPSTLAAFSDINLLCYAYVS